MEGSGIVAGLGAASFWLFIAAVSVAAIWTESKEKQAKLQTLRELLQREGAIDPTAVEALTRAIEGDKVANAKSTKQGLEIAHKITLFVAPGLVFLGLMVGAFFELLGVGGLLLAVSYGLLMASRRITIEEEPA